MRFLMLLYFFPFLLNAQDRLHVDEEIKAYMASKTIDNSVSISKGKVSNGSLKNGKLMPYKGANFIYFDRESYLEGRAFLHGDLRKTVLAAYDSLYLLMPRRYFNIMECSHEHGGKLFPHKTHQNGLSIDFMMPLLKKEKAYYALDTIGAAHYGLQFTNDGKYTKDTAVQIDFDLVARHILILNEFAKKNAMYISKVIIKIELKDALFATKHGKLLKESGIYVVQGLSPIVNALHDDHFHVDFGFK